MRTPTPSYYGSGKKVIDYLIHPYISPKNKCYSFETLGERCAGNNLVKEQCAICPCLVENYELIRVHIRDDN